MTDPPEEGALEARLRALREKIQGACERAGRDPAEVTLVGVSKGQPIEKLQSAWRAGLRVFGENRVQEALSKGPHLPPEVEWHLIGPLQSNKTKKALELFTVVHSVDRRKIARILNREAGERGTKLRCFLEVNLGDEESKHGFPARGFLEAVSPLAELSNLQVMGLMAIPPREGDSRHWFRRLRELRDAWIDRPEWKGSPGHLSMGMSADFEEAIEEGATHIRVGTDLFGPRGT